MKQKIVKRKGQIETFDERKIYASVYEASLSCSLKKQEAENISAKICAEIKKWMKNKPVINSDDIFKETVKLLKKQNEEVAFMYKTQRDIS